MSNNRVGRVVQQLHHVAALRDAQTSDGQLLAAFIAQRDEAAFAALVRRYGPMVLGVCRRVLRNTSDADDAFQAAFLVLVRRAAEVRSRATLGNWLYGVAYRTALHARTANARRRRIEAETRPPDQPTSPEDAAMQSELQNLLDQELNALPAKYRKLIVLCDLLGTTKREAAQQIRCPEGTVSSRLARGRELLRKRLARHGTALSLAALAALLEQNKAPAAPLIDTTVKTAVLVAAGNVIAAGVLTPNAAALMEGVLKSVLLTKLKITAGLLLVVAVLCVSTTLIACRSMAGPQPGDSTPAQKSAPDEKKEKAKEDEKPRVDRSVLRYSGKNFEYWCNVIRTELKSEERLKAFRALQAFARRGYADETKEVMLEVVREDIPGWVIFLSRTIFLSREEFLSTEELKVLIETFGRVGPAAKDAVTILTNISHVSIAHDEDDQVQKAATEALKRIQPPQPEKPKP